MSKLKTAVERLLRIGPVEAMREDERAAGFRVVLPGDEPWLPSLDWHDDVTVSTDGKIVRIIAIRARKENDGAFSRLVTGIIRAGLTPVVIEPMLSMPGIMARWKWERREFGEGFTREEQWWPTTEWMARRAAKDFWDFTMSIGR